mmetsp:Transcript_20627/g.38573  ORF Transcript_20627/g.38573 Transcript_20627/m.38573 type:complete len:94 (+) Transcript_20627:1387-1668(+)
MVVHQHIGVDRDPVLDGHFPQRGEQALAVLITLKDGLAVVASKDDVLCVTWQHEAGKAGHVGSPSVKKSAETNIRLRPLLISGQFECLPTGCR